MGYIEDIRKLVGHRPIILVGSVVLIIDKNKNILLQQRREPYGKWGLVGGLMELGESPQETARRELLEETGLTALQLHLIDVFSGKSHFTKLTNGDEFQTVTVAYYTTEYMGNIQNNKEEGLSLHFFAMNELPEYMVGSHKKMIEAYSHLQNNQKSDTVY